jgi:hypothetical protein
MNVKLQSTKKKKKKSSKDGPTMAFKLHITYKYWRSSKRINPLLLCYINDNITKCFCGFYFLTKCFPDIAIKL